MENPVKRIKFDVNSIDKIKGEACYFDEVPDEVLEKIISFVPNKDACFLVNKRFQKESINATRNRCRLVLDDDNIKEPESILKTGKKFEELWIYSKNDLTESISLHDLLKFKDVIGYFGSSIKTFQFDVNRIYQSDFMEMLGLMKNLERLEFGICGATNNVTAKTVQLDHLKSLKLYTHEVPLGFLNLLSCPAMRELNVITFDDDSDFFEQVVNFICRHTQLKQLTYRDPSMKTIQSIMEIDDLKLTKLKISFWNSDDAAEATAFNLALCKQKDLKVLKLPIDLSMVNGQISRAIAKLPMLETLSISLYNVESILEEIITDIIQVNKLKSFKCSTIKLEHLKPLATFQNLQFEKLSLVWRGENHQDLMTQQGELLQAIAKNLPNLKKAKFLGFEFEAILNFASNSKSLEYLKITAFNFLFSDIELVANPNIRELHLYLGYTKGMKIIKNCVKLMPNVTTLYLLGSVAFDGTESLLSILKLQNLTIFGTESKYLEQSDVISTIMEHGKKLKKIISLTEDPFMGFNAYPAYASQFPIRRHCSKRYENIVMMRD